MVGSWGSRGEVIGVLKELWGGRPLRGWREGSRNRRVTPPDHRADLIPVKGVDEEGGLDRKNVRLQCMEGSLRQVSGPALRQSVFTAPWVEAAWGSISSIAWRLGWILCIVPFENNFVKIWLIYQHHISLNSGSNCLRLEEKRLKQHFGICPPLKYGLWLNSRPRPLIYWYTINTTYGTDEVHPFCTTEG